MLLSTKIQSWLYLALLGLIDLFTQRSNLVYLLQINLSKQFSL